MISSKTVKVLKFASVMGVIPVLVYAYQYGPDPRFTGAPGDNATACVNSGCHAGTVNSAANGGSVAIVLPGAATYTPGVKQHIMVTITDANRKSWGFQLTARLASNLTNGQAGTLSASDTSTQVICDVTGSSAPCAAATTVQFIEHTLVGWSASVNNPGKYTYAFDWTPPATNVGNVMLYAAGNASNSANTNAPNQTTGHIYTTYVLLTPAVATTPTATPTISAGGVISASGFGGFKAAAPGTFVEVYGTNLAPSTDSAGRVWTGSDFTSNGTVAPTILDTVSATVGGLPAYVNFLTPGQIDLLLPSTVTAGVQPLIVTVGGVASAAYSLTVNAAQPGLLAPSSLIVGGKQYMAAFHADGTLVMPPGAVSGVTSSYAKPGETVVLYGIGFGAVTPSTVATAGTIFAGGTNQLALPFTISFAGVAAPTAAYSGLAPGFTGLYQFNILIPQVSNSDFVPVTFTLGGTAGSQTLYTAVHS